MDSDIIIKGMDLVARNPSLEVFLEGNTSMIINLESESRLIRTVYLGAILIGIFKERSTMWKIKKQAEIARHYIYKEEHNKLLISIQEPIKAFKKLWMNTQISCGHLFKSPDIYILIL